MLVNQKVPFKTYRAWDGINVSSLGAFKRSPLHYLYEKENPKDSQAFALGRAVHELILEPGNYNDNFTVAPKVDRRTKAGKEEYANWLTTVGNKEVLTHDEEQEVLKIVNEFANHKTATKLIGGDVEMSTQFELEGVLCKARADVLFRDDFVIDIKTTRDASKDAFLKSIYNYGYYRQAAFYLEAFKRSEFIFIAIEKNPPYGIGIYQLPKDMILAGLDECKYLVNRLNECIKNNNFPGYSNKIEMLEVPNWVYSKMEGRCE